MITIEPCDKCNGKQLEHPVSITADWLEPHITIDDIEHELLAQMIDDPDGWECSIAWEYCECPKCHGTGSYIVEHVDCKIF